MSQSYPTGRGSVHAGLNFMQQCLSFTLANIPISLTGIERKGAASKRPCRIWSFGDWSKEENYEFILADSWGGRLVWKMSINQQNENFVKFLLDIDGEQTGIGRLKQMLGVTPEALNKLPDYYKSVENGDTGQLLRK